MARWYFDWQNLVSREPHHVRRVSLPALCYNLLSSLSAATRPKLEEDPCVIHPGVNF
jgi:hypothetical protein